MSVHSNAPPPSNFPAQMAALSVPANATSSSSVVETTVSPLPDWYGLLPGAPELQSSVPAAEMRATSISEPPRTATAKSPFPKKSSDSQAAAPIGASMESSAAPSRSNVSMCCWPADHRTPTTSSSLTATEPAYSSTPTPPGRTSSHSSVPDSTQSVLQPSPLMSLPSSQASSP